MPVTTRDPGSKIVSSRAIASAVAGWSPVIITERMCARLATMTASLRLGARRVDHADKAEQDELVLDALRQLDSIRGGRGLRIDAERGGRHGARRDRQRAQRLARERFVAPQEFGAALLAQRHDLAVLEQEAALGQQDFGRALDENAQLGGVVAVAMHGRVPLALGREGDFRDARKARQLRLGNAELARGDHQRALGRVALHAPATLRG